MGLDRLDSGLHFWYRDLALAMRMSFDVFCDLFWGSSCKQMLHLQVFSVSMFLLRSFEERLLRVPGGAFAKD